MNRTIHLERVFELIKVNHKFRQFLLRGKKKLKLICTACNIRRLRKKTENEYLEAAFHKKVMLERQKNIFLKEKKFSNFLFKIMNITKKFQI